MSTSTKFAGTLPAPNLPVSAQSQRRACPKGNNLHVSLLTGGFDKPYAYGLSIALASHNVCVDVIGSDEIDSSEMHSSTRINFLNWQHGWRTDASVPQKAIRLLGLYLRLAIYSARTRSGIFHILWNNKFTYFDRTLLVLYFRMLGKRITLTAHNVNTAKRDRNDSWLNRVTLKAQYRLADRIFVHTEKMRTDLVAEFAVRPEAVIVIPFGINTAAVHTRLTPAEAKHRLDIRSSERTVLFFGRIQPYKGLEYLIEACEMLSSREGPPYRLIVAGEPKKEYWQYWHRIRGRIESGPLRDQVVLAIRYISDADTEVYFKAADALVLPYTDIYQSGVLFLGYSFGLPAIATDVGSFREEVIEGKTGLICRRAESVDLARAIERYFGSPMYANLNASRESIQAYAQDRYSWDLVADISIRTYEEITQR